MTTEVGVSAVIFDFNGTLSDDEPVLCEIFIHLFAEHGRPMSAQEYFDELAGLSDPEIVTTWLGEDHPDVRAVIAERETRYRAAAADGSTIHEHVREAVRFAAERVPLAICSGAARAEIEPVVEAAGISVVLPRDRDLERRRPRQARSRGLREDARAARGRPGRAPSCSRTPKPGSRRPARPASGACSRCARRSSRTGSPQADELIDRIDVDVMRRLLL